ncbi:MAG TPA: class D sortase [Terriglobales bacterium]
MMVLGLALLSYVGVEYGQMFWAQRALERKWSDQQHARAQHRPGPTPAALADDGLTRLSIPKIDLQAIVVEGTSNHSLKLGPGHMKDTPAPGEVGNSVISAHRDTFFRHIYELQKGDEIQVERGGRTYRYAVVSKHIVDPNDMSVVKPSKDSRLTLITCYPTYYIGPAPNRLIVTSTLITDSASSPPASVENASQVSVEH